MKVGYRSPLPPVRSGVADYAWALLERLRLLGDVSPAHEGAALNIYHIGNNSLHAASYREALDRPGVVVLHDAVLQHLMLTILDERQYMEEFVYNYGEWSRDLAMRLYRRRSASAAGHEYFEYAMVRRLAERSRAVVVHNPGAAAIVKRHAPDARVVEIPHLYAPAHEPALCEAIRLRQRLGIPPGGFVFGVFGYLRESKRILQVLRAFASVHREFPRTVLLLAGSFVSQTLEAAVSPLLASSGVYRAGGLPERLFLTLLRAVDCGVNLRAPAAGETSGIGIHLMGAAKPVLFSRGLETSRIPEDAAVFVDPGPGEVPMLSQCLAAIASRPAAAREMGLRAAEYIRRRHAAEAAASQLWQTVCAVAS